MAYKKYCVHVGCNKLIDITKVYCPAHSRTNAERNAEYDKTQRDKKAKAYYNSAEWKAARARTLARDTGIDIYLYVTEGRVVPATMVHHIVELREDYTKRSSPSNLISVSEATHEGAIKQAYASVEAKRDMQRTLRRCIAKYQELVGGGY